jgi:hypothetical protein
MDRLRKTLAALGFVCFFSLALLPVSMTVCGPVTWRLNHHAKRLHALHAGRDLSPRFVVLQHQAAGLERDIIPEEDSARNLLEYPGIASNPAGVQPDNPEIYTSQGFFESARVSSFESHTVLIL